MELEPATLAFLCIAFFCGGFMDGIAGGGGLLTLPAMLLTGLPPETALGTNKFAAYSGVLASLGSYARSGFVLWKAALTGVPAMLIGDALGAGLLLSFDSAMVGKILVFMLPVGLFAVFMPKKDGRERPMKPYEFYSTLPLICFILGIYDGFFGPGSGTFFVIAFHAFLGMGLLQSVASAKMIGMAGGIGACLVFAVRGHINYLLALPLCIACAAGNILGSRMAMQVGPNLVRRFLVISLALLFASLIGKFWFKS
ncbi:UPF0721 transmembrane protein [Deltaproteobacteria bacterium]|nr:UPF0721 transmembrane protein [Deltaproteobacteria bacterium]